MPRRCSAQSALFGAVLLGASVLACTSDDPVPPIITAIEPDSALEAASVDVTVRGDRFYLTAQRRFGTGTRLETTFRVWLGGVPLVDVRRVSSTELTARIAGDVPPGIHPLVVETVYGTTTLDDAFVVLPIEHCSTGADEDGDGLVDCADPDCRNDEACFVAGPWPYPSNFDPAALSPSGSALAASCDAVFDTTTDTFTTSCGLQPNVTRVGLSNGREATVLAFGDLTIEATASLTLIGAKPAILAVFGDARIDGQVLANSTEAQQGAGARAFPVDAGTCLGRAGGIGGTSAFGGDPSDGAGGGGAGYRHTGGVGGNHLSWQGGAGGELDPAPAPGPLRGGCPGGSPAWFQTGSPGTGGGALQLWASQALLVSGVLSVSGAGGSGGGDNWQGGHGGGSGGTLVLEAEQITLTDTAKLTANGGGGGGGSGTGAARGERGDDGATTASQPAAGGLAGSADARPGGAGGSGLTAPGAGGTTFLAAEGSGGGGGSAGAIFLRSPAAQCNLAPMAVISPPPTSSCP